MEKQYLSDIMDHPLLGRILPVDFNPLKTCSFNCYYCNLGKTTKMTMEREEFYPVQDIFEKVDEYLQENKHPDTIFLTGSGEPALYSGFGDLARKIKAKYPSITITAYSNASLLNNTEVRKDFCECDIMQFNLNAVEPEEFKKINRHHVNVKVDNVIKGLKAFKAEFNKPIWIHSIFGDNFNISKENIIGLRNFIADFNPNKYIIRKFEKENDVDPLKDETINFIKTQMDSLNCECHYIGFN